MCFQYMLMYGFEIVEIKNISRKIRLVELPLITKFNVYVKGNLDDLKFNIKLEAEGENQDEVTSKLEQQRKNLKLYLNLISQQFVDVIQESKPEFHNEKLVYEENWRKTLEVLQDPNISKFVSSRYTQQDTILQIGLDEVFNNQMFNGFPKLVNWLDDNVQKGASRFCKIRDVCSHGVTDNAILKVNEEFPGKFEFEDKVLVRDSTKNDQSMRDLLPELLDQIKEVFKRRFSNNS